MPHHAGNGLDLIKLHGLVHVDAMLLQKDIHYAPAERRAVVTDERLRGQQLTPGRHGHGFRHGQDHRLAQ
ncbi:hypothetical protein D3C73_1548820 [compost metagenome]